MKKLGCVFIILLVLSSIYYVKEIKTSKEHSVEHVETELKQDTGFISDKRETEKSDKSTTNDPLTDEETILMVDDDMSLGGIYLGSTIQEVFETHGQTSGYRDPNDGMYFRYQYDDLDVVFVRNRVVRVASRTDKIQTRQGLRQGDTLDQVIQTYGNDYEKTERNDEILYMYNLLSPNHVPYQLRFACKDNIVCCVAVEGLLEYIVHRKISDVKVQRL